MQHIYELIYLQQCSSPKHSSFKHSFPQTKFIYYLIHLILTHIVFKSGSYMHWLSTIFPDTNVSFIWLLFEGVSGALTISSMSVCKSYIYLSTLSAHIVNHKQVSRHYGPWIILENTIIPYVNYIHPPCCSVFSPNLNLFFFCLIVCCVILLS